MKPGEEWGVLVDRDDRVTGSAPRGRIRGENLLHRGVAILCRNGKGQVYVHRRTDTKDVFPGLYDMFIGGMVAQGESYEETARRWSSSSRASMKGPATLPSSTSSR